MPGSTSTLARVTVEVEDGIVNSPTSHNISSASSAAGTCWKLNRRNRTLALVALVAMSVALGLALSRRENKIDRDLIPSHVIGGSVAGPDRYSYAVSLQNSYGHFCGGSLITRDIVLTAAHCWEGFFDPITGEADPNLKAVAGRHDLDDVYNGESIPILGNSPHPDYMKAVYLNNDFMLLALETGFTAGNVELVKLNSDASRPCVGQDLTAMGWGEVDPHVCRDPLSPLLKHLNVNVVSNELCKLAEGFVNGTDLKYETFITDNVLCAWANQEGNCQGDSGGPLVIKGADAASDVQVGVVSFGGDCASPTLPFGYARVSEAYDWIQSEVCAYNSITANEAGFDCPLVSTYSPTASPITYAPTFTPAPTKAPIQCNADTPCAEGMCCSFWGYCGYTEEYCGECCINGCSSSTSATATLSPTFGAPSTFPPSTFLPMSQQFTAPPSSSPPSTYEPTSQQSLAFDVPTTSLPPSTINPILLQPSTYPPAQATPFPTFDTTHSLSTLPPQIHITPFPTFEATSTPPTVNGTSLLSLVPSEQ